MAGRGERSTNEYKVPFAVQVCASCHRQAAEAEGDEGFSEVQAQALPRDFP